MKELNRFRKFLSENTTMPDFTIMGQKFNFSDICPSAHKLVQNQAIVHQGFSRTAPTVLEFAIKHREFFNLERKALGSQGITADEYNDDVTRLYTEILNIAEKLGVRKKAKEYMDMHMAKIKDAGFKASEPGGSSDRNFGNISENTSRLDFGTKGGFSHSFELGTEPEAYELIKSLIDTHTQNSGELSMKDDVFKFAEASARFFGWQKEALNWGVTLDEYLKEIKPIYNEVLEIAKSLGVYDETKKYMDTHMAKIKNEGIKGDKFGLNEKGYEPTDKELDFADEIEYEQDWRDEQDDLFGVPDYKRRRGYYMDEEGDEDEFLEEALKEVRNRLGDAIEGYTDLHKNDVVLESFLGEGYSPQDYKKVLDYIEGFFSNDMAAESYVNGLTDSEFGDLLKYVNKDDEQEVKDFLELEESLKESNAERNPIRGIKNMFQAIIPLKLDTATLGSLGYAKATGIEGDWNAIQFFTEYPDKYEKYKDLLKQANRFGVDVNPSTNVLNAYNAIAAAANEYELKEDQKKINEGPVKTFTSGLDNYQSYPHVYVFKVRTMSTDKQGGKFVYNHTYEVKDGLDWNGVLAQVDQLIASPETIGVGVDIYYTTGQSEGQLGGQAEVVRWLHDATYKAPKSDYILNARKNQFENEEAERIIAIRKFMNSSLMGRPPQNVDNQAETLYPAIKRMKDEVKNILANK